MNDSRLQVAVIGSGVAGITAAYLLSKKHQVTIFEKDSRLGGHTNTFQIMSGPDAGLGIDTGFIVLNDRTYPLLHKLFAEWGVPVRNADMSFGYHDLRSGLMYGSRDINMLLANRLNICNPVFWGMVNGILKFWRELPRACDEGRLTSSTLGEFINGRYPASFVEHYLKPFAGAIWSASGSSVLDMPAELCARFFTNHGMLSYSDNPQWQTVVGGSSSYVKAFASKFSGTILSGDGVTAIKRETTSVAITTASGSKVNFDRVVVATHADQALKLLIDPSNDEQRLLRPWSYSKNRTVLHTDHKLLPPKKRAIAAWNYRRELVDNQSSPITVTYHMNTLQGLASKNQYCVTLNPQNDICDQDMVAEFNYTHPDFTHQSFATQSELGRLNGVNNTWFCGSYFRWGFHEDAVRSAVAVARDFGIEI